MNIGDGMAQAFKLLTRDEFKEKVFGRDQHKCVICGAPAADPHHIIDRSRYPDHGYYLENGASLCNPHHMDAERTTLSVEDIRKAAGIKIPALPPGVTLDDTVDKWLNPVLPNKTRMRGPMFYDEPVQKVLKEAKLLDSFTHWVKYPQTKHLDFSPGVGKDDDILSDLSELEGFEVVVTLKMDGESFTMYSDHSHARSLDSLHNFTRDWAKGFWAERRFDIPDRWHVSAENLWARHSIAYDHLPSYVLGLSVWNEWNVKLSWDETLEYFELLRMLPVPVLWRGTFTMAKMKEIAANIDTTIQEGFVVCRTDEVPYGSFGKRFAKWVRAGHVQTDTHWLHSEIVPNGLAKGEVSFDGTR